MQFSVVAPYREVNSSRLALREEVLVLMSVALPTSFRSNYVCTVVSFAVGFVYANDDDAGGSVVRTLLGRFGRLHRPAYN